MKSQYYRTFIALPIRVDPGFLQARNNLVDVLDRERISWTDPAQYHVTLRFLGDTERLTIKRIGDSLQNDISVPRQIRMDLSGLDSFGPHKKPRVIWVGFEESSFFVLLKKEVDRALELCGIPMEEQLFQAHLTLGRIRSLKNLERYYLKIDEMNQYFKGSVLFDRLVFFRSVLGSGGPEYQVLEEMLFS